MLWQNVPARIPTHWGVSGSADSFSDSITAWLVCLAFAVGALVAAGTRHEVRSTAARMTPPRSTGRVNCGQ
ncbi:DUF1648 domain-containing protein [Leifsonia sp. Root112D2]|uniref:DUF1648 domain-containing protein n=1 Tax=Leifsonia sp. Root112D2 TaxID=1736426 RepID=UPI0009E6752E